MLKGLIVFEGGEGCGKTTQIKLLSRYLDHHKIAHITTREPGGTPLGESLRNVMLSDEIPDPVVEYLIITAARLQHINEVILPNLALGKLVLCDRFISSTLVYQVMSKGMELDLFKKLNQQILGDVTPELSIYFDLQPKLVAKRTARRGASRDVYDNKNLKFHQQLREAFLTVAKNSESFRIIDANQSIESISTEVITNIEPLLNTS